MDTRLYRIRQKATGKWLQLKMGIQVSWVVSPAGATLFEGETGPSLMLKNAIRLLKGEGEWELVEYKQRKRT
jgi:hypothetical protein